MENRESHANPHGHLQGSGTSASPHSRRRPEPSGLSPSLPFPALRKDMWDKRGAHFQISFPARRKHIHTHKSKSATLAFHHSRRRRAHVTHCPSPLLSYLARWFQRRGMRMGKGVDLSELASNKKKGTPSGSQLRVRDMRFFPHPDEANARSPSSVTPRCRSVENLKTRITKQWTIPVPFL